MKTQLQLLISILCFLPLSLFSQCWQSVSVGNTHTIALTPEGSLWTWGLNSYGLGDGSVHSNIPKQLGTDTDWKFISTENKHSFAIKTDGSLWGWGYNWSGQLGNGTNTDLEFLTRIGTDTDWDWVSSGHSHSVGIKTDGTLWAWGYNNSGQLGTGTNTGSVRAPVLTNCAVLSPDDIEQSLYSVYPNPVSNILIIDNPIGGNYQLNIINQLDQIVLRQKKNISSTSLDVSALSKGLYFLNINSENKRKQVIKFIKNQRNQS